MSEDETGEERCAQDGKTVRTSAKTRRTKAEPAIDPEAKTAEEKPVFRRVRNFKRHTRKLMSDNFARIMNSLAEKAINGSVAHVKYLFEIGGVREELEREGDGKAEPSLAEVMLGEMRRQREEELARAKTGSGIGGGEAVGRYCGANAQ
jgi:hypothetical protein